MEKYLISTVHHYLSAEIAEKRGLKSSEWVHVPSFWTSGEREKVLIGRRVSDEKYLVGSFTEEEKKHLIKGGVSNMRIDIETLDIIIDSFKKKVIKDIVIVDSIEGNASELKTFKMGRIEAMNEAREVLETIKESLE